MGFLDLIDIMRYLRTLAPLLLLLTLAPAASAHTLPNQRYDRVVAVRLTPDGVVVRYSLEVTQWTIFTDGAKLFTPAEIAKLDRTGRGLVRAYAAKIAPEIAHDLHAAVDGQPLTFRLEPLTEPDLGEHPKFQFVYKASWPVGPKRRAFAFEDESFPGKPGILNLTLDVPGGRESGITLDDVIEPDPRWRLKPTIELKPDEAAKPRKASAVVNLPHAIAAVQTPGADTPGSPNTPGTPTTPGADTPGSPNAPGSPEQPSLMADLFSRGLPAVFDSPYGIGVLLLAAFLFGAAHAFTPGHGKTLVAAYLVGERGTVGHAVILGVTTTVAHTGSVLLIALGLRVVYGDHPPQQVGAVLEFLGGLFVLVVGFWLLLLRLTGRADHVHLFAGDHHHHHHLGDRGQETGDNQVGHHHHHAPPPDATKTRAGWVRVVLLGLGGGLIPCWDAVLLLVVAIALNRFGFAIPLLIAFSLGLAVVLVLLGVAVVHAHRAGLARFGESRWFRLLPVVSSVVLIGTGFWLCKAAVAAATAG